jgi:hypothetical protein
VQKQDVLDDEFMEECWRVKKKNEANYKDDATLKSTAAGAR